MTIPEPRDEVERPETVSEDSPAVKSEDAQTADPARPKSKSGIISGRISDTEIVGHPVSGARVELICTCLKEQLIATTGPEGEFSFEALPAGVYTVHATRGGERSTARVSMSTGNRQRVELAVGPPFTTEFVKQNYLAQSRAKTMIGAGGVLEVAALLLLIGAVVENRKPDCMFERDTCDDAPRPAVTTGLGIGSGVAAATGALLIGLGIRDLRRLRAEIDLDEESAMLRFSGRF